MPKTRPGSRSHQIVDVVATLTAHRGRGVTVPEIAEAFEKATGSPAPPSLTSEVGALAHRKVLEVVGGRVGHYLYAQPGADLPISRKHDDALVVLEAVRSGYRRIRMPLSTRAVEEEIERRGVRLETRGPNTVRKHLEALARERKRGPKNLRASQVERVTMQTESGRPRSYWVPAGQSFTEADVAPWSAAEAIRAAVRSASGVLGRPLSVKELRAWAGSASCTAGMRHALKGVLIGRALADTARADLRSGAIEGRIQVVNTEATAFGGAPARYQIGAPTPQGIAICRAEDALLAFRPAEDAHSIDVLRRRASIASSEALQRLAEIRQRLLASSLSESFAGLDASVALQHMEVSSQVLRGWWESTAKPSRNVEDRRAGILLTRTAQLAAVRALLPLSTPETGLPCRVGQVALVGLPDLQYWLECAVQKAGVAEEKAVRILVRARRFPAPSSPGLERFGAAGSRPLAHLDRVDGLRQLFRSFPVSRAKVLVEQGALALGMMLRDADVLHELLASLPPRDGFGRRTLVLALGLLGRVVEVEQAVPDPDRADDTSAWVLATVIADPSEARDHLRAADRRARAGARKVTDTALLRLRAGYGYSVVER